MYRERMLGYYPQIIQAILEFRGIIDAEAPEFEVLSEANWRAIDDAYLTTMSEDRVEQWENIFGIDPLKDSTIDDRRETIIARIRGQGKLNTALINNIVKTFTGGTANSWVKDSVLYVEVTPPPGNKQYKFENVEQELSLRVPAHLGFKISRNYYEWTDVLAVHPTWQDIKDGFDSWEGVFLFTPFNS